MSQFVNGNNTVKLSSILRGNKPTIHGSRSNNENIRLTGYTSDALITTQDGNGRIQHKWNARYGTQERYLVSNEPAWFWDISAVGDPYMQFKYAPSGTANNRIPWKSHMAFRPSGAVGIGVDRPVRKLQVAGAVKANTYLEEVRTIDTANGNSYNVLNGGDSVILIRTGGRSSNFTINLPNANSEGLNYKFKIIQEKGQGGKTLIKPASGQRIENMGANSSYVMDSSIIGNLGCVQIISDGSQWWIINTV